MATQLSACISVGSQLGLRVALCEPDQAVRAQLRAAIDADPLLVFAAESSNWMECETCLDDVVPELLIVRSELLPDDWNLRSAGDHFQPVVIELRTTLSFPSQENVLRVPAEPHAVKSSLDRAVRDVYERKAKQLLFLVDRYVQGSRAASPYKAVLKVEREGSLFDLRTENIVSVLAARKYVWIRSTAGKFMLREPIHEMSERLDPCYFVRIHRSVIINLRHIDRTSPLSEKPSEVVLTDGSRYPVGPSYRDALQQAMGNAELKSRSA